MAPSEVERVADTHGQFVWYELMTTDARAAEAFYTKVVGWGTRDASSPGAPYTLFTAGEIPIGGMTHLPEEAMRIGVRPGWLGYVAVDDVDAAAGGFRRLGGTVHVPPMDIPDISRFSIVADPQGAALALVKWLTAGEAPPAERDKAGRVGWHELMAADWAKAFAVYAELFGWQKGPAVFGPSGAYQRFAIAGQMVGGMYTKPPMAPVPYWLYYFNVHDIDAAARRVAEAGGQILEGPIEYAGAWVARCVDPQGAMFALIGMRAAVGYFVKR
jgi:predicted enzyme related to lactoylglutathione lyase